MLAELVVPSSGHLICWIKLKKPEKSETKLFRINTESLFRSNSLGYGAERFGSVQLLGFWIFCSPRQFPQVEHISKDYREVRFGAVNLREEPIFRVITLANRVNQVFVRIQLRVPVAESMLPEPVQESDSKNWIHSSTDHVA